MDKGWGADAWGGDSTSEADLERLLAQVDVSALGKKAKPKSKPSLPAPPPPPKPPSVDAEPVVELGFVSPYPEAPAKAWHFPSKVGGEPVWLLPERLPTDSLHCAAGCGRQMRFLMQLYCPRPEVPHAYHRSLMLFCCGGKCLRSQGGWRALRCNLPQDMPWYVEHPDGTWSAHGREALHTDGADGVVGAASTDGAEGAAAQAALEAHFDEHMARAVAQGHLSEAAADAMTDEIAAKSDSAARCEAMRRIMREHPDRTYGAGEASVSADALATETSAAATATTAAATAAATAVATAAADAFATAAMPPVASAAAAVPSSPLPSLPELLISVDLEGDWRALLTDADAQAEAEAQRLFTAYEASAAATLGGGGLESAGASGSASDGGSARAAERPSGGSREDDEDLAGVDDEEVEESFYAFQRRTSAHPQQALRYNRAMHAEPLWAGTAGRPPPGMPPSCPRCGARRNFEFQLMPQLLCELEEHGYVESATSLAASMLGPRAARAGAPEAPSDGLDWGTVVVYTCSASCATAEGAVAEHCGYAEEYVWHQLIG